jgi:hypothetical protein
VALGATLRFRAVCVGFRRCKFRRLCTVDNVKRQSESKLVTMCDDCTDRSRPLFLGVHVWVLDACARGLLLGLALVVILRMM